MKLIDRLTREEWNIGVVDQPIAEIVRHGIRKPVRWFPGNSWRIFADPFCIVNADNSVTILAEMMNHWVGRGEIWRATVPCGDDPLTAKFTPHVTASAHLSYPSYVQDGGTTYALMESYETARLMLWRYDGVSWHCVKTLLDRPAVDPTIYFDGKLWWLFCTFSDDKPDDHLQLYFANSLLDEWTPHPSNPVKVGRAGTRPGGSLFAVDSMLIRPSQDSSETYGGRLFLNHVTTLSPDHFTEVSYRIIEPTDNYYSAGIHTIAAAGDYTVVDGKRWHVGISNLPMRLNAKLRRKQRWAQPPNIIRQLKFL